MKLNDQILLLKNNNKHKIILLSGYLNYDEDKLVAYDLFGNEFLVDWDLASYGQQNKHKFKYWHNKTNLDLLIMQEEVLQKLGLTVNQEITLEMLKDVEKYLNSKPLEQVM